MSDRVNNEFMKTMPNNMELREVRGSLDALRSAACIAAEKVVRVWRAYFAKYGCMNCDGALVKLIARELGRFNRQPPNVRMSHGEQ